MSCHSVAGRPTTNADRLAGPTAVACTGGPRLDAPATLDLTCRDAHRQCAIAVPVAVQNCSDSPMTLLRVELVDPSDGVYQNGVLLMLEPNTTELRAQATFEHTIHWNSAGSYHLVAHLTDATGAAIERRQNLALRNPARDAARAACDACDGHWGGHGMLGLEGCNCQTQDAGEPCHASADCQGICLFEAFDAVPDDSPLAAAGPECADRQVRYIQRGTCSERQMIFGCHSRIAEVRYECRYPAMAGRAPYICVD